MYRYTTPTVGIVFPESVDPDDIVDFWLTLRQLDTIKINKTKSSFTQDSENEQRFYCVLTETETSTLNADIPCEVQVRASIDGQSVASDIKVVDVADVLKEGEIL